MNETESYIPWNESERGKEQIAVILKAAKMIAPELEDRGENFLEKVREETENMSVDFKSARENILRWMIENKIPKHLISVFDQNVVYGDDDLSNLGKRLGGV